MGQREVERGPVARRVADNVRKLRDQRGLTLQQLSELLTEVGRPIVPSGVGKIEQLQRRVDVDDLVALALALDVTPNRLLLTGTADSDERIGLTANHDATESWAWVWASGQMLPLVPWPPDKSAEPISGNAEAHKRRVRFTRENNPHHTSGPSFEEIAPHLDRLREAWQAVHDAIEATDLPATTVLEMIRATEAQQGGGSDGR